MEAGGNGDLPSVKGQGSEGCRRTGKEEMERRKN